MKREDTVGVTSPKGHSRSDKICVARRDEHTVDPRLIYCCTSEIECGWCATAAVGARVGKGRNVVYVYGIG